MVRRRGGKAALFREHVVVRQPRLRHDAEDAPAVQHGRAVVELAPGAQRHAEHDDGVAVLRVRADVQQRFFGRIEQQRGQKGILTQKGGMTMQDGFLRAAAASIPVAVADPRRNAGRFSI